jgi:GTPase
MIHKSGFVNIIGRPNVGKSTLMNALVGERMSIITAKPQTTRHRIIGILSGEDFQIVFSDTPGFIRNPNYKMQKTMNHFVEGAFEDADVALFVVDAKEYLEEEDALLKGMAALDGKRVLVVNKRDLVSEEELANIMKFWDEKLEWDHKIAISAQAQLGTQELLDTVKSFLPEGPEYYPKDQLTDRPERFFVSEIIREKILEQFHQEIPYSVEVNVQSFKEGKDRLGNDITRIEAYIYCARESQKAIILGHKGESIKKLGTAARISIEKWLETKVHLELRISVKDNWRDDDIWLKRFGY